MLEVLKGKKVVATHADDAAWTKGKLIDFDNLWVHLENETLGDVFIPIAQIVNLYAVKEE